jgi:hypothetical protein
VKAVRVEVASPLRHLFRVTACIAGPDIAGREQAVRSMLATVRFAG